MNTNIKRTAIFIVVVAAIGAGSVWYIAAGDIVARTKKLIDTTNAKPHADGTAIKMTYDSLERTMFPHIGARFVNPAIEVNSPGAPAMALNNGSPRPIEPQPFHLTWHHAGTIDVMTDYLTKEYRLVNNGSATGSLDTGTDKMGITAAPAHSEFSLKAKTQEAFRAWQSLDLSNPDAVKAALSQIGGAHGNAGAVKLTDTATNAIILTQDEVKFDLTNQSDDKKIKFDLTFVSKGAQVTKEYSDLVTHAMTMLHLPTGITGTSMPMAASRAGKQDIDIAMNVDLPQAAQANLQMQPIGDIHVTKLSIKNDFYQLSAPLDVVLHEDATRRHATIKLDWSLAISPVGAKEMQLLLDDGLPMASNYLGASASNMDQALLKEKIIAALPNVSTLGPVALVLDVDASVPKPDAPKTATAADGKAETLTLRQFRFEHKRWGIDAHGEASNNAATRGGTVNGTLTCKQCTTLSQDMYETVHAVQDVLALLQPTDRPYPLTEAMLTQLNTTLGEIGRPGTASGDLDFVITTPAPNDMRVNDKPIGQILPQLMMVFAPPPVSAPPSVAPQPSTPGAPAI